VILSNGGTNGGTVCGASPRGDPHEATLTDILEYASGYFFRSILSQPLIIGNRPAFATPYHFIDAL
jgi:hypothetical protein